MIGHPPTLTQINGSQSSKRLKRGYLSYSTSYHQSSSSDEDYSQPVFIRHPSSAMEQLSKAFEQGGSSGGDSDQLSASFKGLYKSIFGHSVCSGEYLNPPPLPPSTVTELDSSDSSYPLGASALSLLGNINPTGSNYGQHFSALMDSFRDIAVTNSWDKLEPMQVQGLMQSFRAAERDQFGLDAESFSRISSSFEQFFQQLNDRIVSTGAVMGDRQASDHGEYQSNVPGSSDGATQPLVELTYTENQTMFPISGMSPPSNYPPPSLHSPPSPSNQDIMTHVATQDHTHHMTSDLTLMSQHLPTTQQTVRQHAGNVGNKMFPTPAPTVYLQGANSPVRSQGASSPIDIHTPHRSTFENDDDDDFDWSTIM